MDSQTENFGVKELAELGGVARRTVRYYVQRGLLPTPTGTGRGNHYTREHLDRLIQIREWQAQGVSLTEIAARLGVSGSDAAQQETAAPANVTPLPIVPQQRWFRVEVGEGIEVHLRRERALDSATLQRLERAIRKALDEE
ncbi:MAG: hypothetical protein AUK47_09995 [Deltaproteobacteria bacterium CG2_30_63_29]|nr:MAG: hypothetical protein AUK47_09995 [Deltaproteobacteria bacterium CG2_30_63_29]PJB49244.1 MAG: MerR family transcriptional regulator [Deltaproteobacteria bacterium CG_4_9_14_3_um_filter_63_12]